MGVAHLAKKWHQKLINVLRNLLKDTIGFPKWTPPPKSKRPLEEASLFSLPPEIQDLIFGHLLISSYCVSYVDQCGILIYDQNIEHNIAALGAQDRLAKGLCEFST